MKIMGIDPGLADVGYGIIERDDRTGALGHCAHGVIRTFPRDALARRLDHIYQTLRGIIEVNQPEVVAIEELFFAANMKTAIAVAQARGAAILATAQSGVELIEYTPPQIKLAVVGHGRADKRQVQMMTRAVLGMKEIPRPDHAADALAVAICHAHGLNSVRRKAMTQKGTTRNRGDAETARAETEPEFENPNKALLALSRTRRRR